MGHEVSLVHQGEETREGLQACYSALAAAPLLPIRNGEARFELVLAVAP